MFLQRSIQRHESACGKGSSPPAEQREPHDSLGRVPSLTFLPRPSAAGKSPLELFA